MPKFINLTGKRFGRLVVIKQEGKDKFNRICWLCLCDCKQQVIIRGDCLKNNNTKSCGCLRKEITKANKIKHGYNKRNKRSKIYQTWNDMIQRCTNPNRKNYKNYGGRGIKVYKRWMKFENFLIDMGEVPEGHQIDRINNNRNYCKSNCRWATRKQQMRNTRKNRLLTYQGKTQCISAWAEELNINQHTLANRIFRYGWSVKKALTTSICKRDIKNGR